jgi:protein-disulfide isomerase
VSSSIEDEGDLTRKQRREQARAQRRELEEAEAAAAVRRTRLTRLGIVVAVVVAAIVVILIATGSGSKKGLAKNPEEQKHVITEVTSLIGGIPQNGAVLGDPKAPVTLQYFGDLECPVCKAFTEGALSSLIQQWVRPHKLKIEYRSMQTATREPETFKTQQVAALAAGKQQKGWTFLELFYHEQGEEGSDYVSENYLQGLAQQVPGLNLGQWTTERNNPELSNQVASDMQAANAAGFTGTPAFLFGKTGGPASRFEYASLTDPTSFNQAIEKLLKA